jgi:hypothetical protein
MDKFSDVFKASVAVFHGIIATWLYLNFSETSVDEFQFLLLVVCFAVVNVLAWNFIVLVFMSMTRGPGVSVPLMTGDIARLSYRTVDVIGLTLIAIFFAVMASYATQKDAVLGFGNLLMDLRRTDSPPPFDLILSNISARTMNKLDGRDGKIVAQAGGQAYLRIYEKDTKFAYEGFPRGAPTRSNPREIFLSPACRYSRDKISDGSKPFVEKIEGPGVFVRVTENPAFEVIDRKESPCAKLFDAS